MSSVVLLAIGSRGDVQPMAVLAGALQAQGVTAKVIALAEYRDLIRQFGAEPVTIPAALARITDQTRSRWGRLLVRSTAGQGVLLQRWLAELTPMLLDVVDATIAPGDTVLTGMLTRDVAVALAEQRGCRVATLLYTAQLPTVHHDSHYFSRWFTSWQPYNRWGTRLNWQIASSLGLSAGKPFRRHFGLPIRGAAGATRAADEHPTVLLASPTFIPPAPDWPSNAYQTGFLAMPRIPFLPDEGLVDFLAAGEAPIHVGFGSMTATTTDKLGLIIDAARLARRRVVTAAPPGRRPGPADDRVFMVGPIPHSWLLPRMAGVVHHGGAGTSHDGLLAGVPSVAVPFGVDQPYHADRLHALGVGPAPVGIRDLTAHRLADLLTELASGRFTERAAEVGERMRTEDGVGLTIELLGRLGLVSDR